jgi:hypothetical protein
MTSQSVAPAANGVLVLMSRVTSHHPGHYSRIEQWKLLEEVYKSQHPTSNIKLRAEQLSRLSLFNPLPFQLDHRDQSLLFHCKYKLVLSSGHASMGDRM